ncbi:GNAT family N-acetyltransferase [Providencia vermicola]|uniref:GNAT family N-acetyltransferase n=1 Tax=Providencia vermicola TaxID=333965 RepID=UPI001CEDD3B7|nr:GNAT family N-acetyltransferase [Providencia vermicola]
MEIVTLTSIDNYEEQLASLLIDSVEHGASVGFLAPLSIDEASGYWQQIKSDLMQQKRFLITCINDDKIVGAVQIALCLKANGLHRADVEKLMVHSQFRQQGIATQLLNVVEKIALKNNLTLLVLDTRSQDVASALYRKQGYREVGEIPNFVVNSQGQFEGTTFFYKLLV